MNNILKTKELGQQIWLDNLSRSLIQSHQLKQKCELGITGITTNPSIFAKAIANDSLYLDDIKQLNQQDLSAKEKYEILVIKDVQDACDVLTNIYYTSHFQYGYVSIELDPTLSQLCDESIQEARRLWQTINRPNLMIKVPATEAGIKAFEILISEGINVNITLLFSLELTKRIHYAYLNGLKTRLLAHEPVQQIRAVASFFLSRIDTALDITLPESLRGKVAIAIAKQAYQDWLLIFNPQQLATLKKQNAEPIWLLWASTGTKNAAYSDVLYVENIIAPYTVNTLPDQTLECFLEHGRPHLSLMQQLDKSKKILQEVAELGISLESLAIQLQKEGLIQFEDAFQNILTQLSLK